MSQKRFIAAALVLFVLLIGGLTWNAVRDPIQRKSVDLDQVQYRLPEYVGSDPEKAPKIDPDQALEQLSKAKSYTAAETLASFFGFLKNGEYYAAASMINIDQYASYFLIHPDQLESNVSTFGQIITKKGTLKEVAFTPAYVQTGLTKINTAIAYQDGSVLKYTFALQQKPDLHSGAGTWVIDLDIPDFLSKVAQKK